MRQSETIVNLSKRLTLLNNFPCFATLSGKQSEELADFLKTIDYAAQEEIVKENDLIDSVYIIVDGQAEVTREVKRRKKVSQVPVASLQAGEAIGLNDTGFYSTTGKRTATVKAITPMTLLRLDLEDLYAFLHKHDLELSMYAASKQMLRMQFIKQSLPFSKLTPERLGWLADRVDELTIPSGTILFNQGEKGDKCYLIRSGQIEIVTQDETSEDHRLAVLKPPVLFGEATLISHEPRNATARALEDSELLVLPHQYLSELIESEDAVANMFMTLMVDRSRPKQNPHVQLHTRTTADGHEVTILKNPDNGGYFKISQEGAFIWEQLDGKHTLQEITLSLAEKHQVFAPDVVVALISKLTKSGYISNLEIHDEKKLNLQPLWVKAIVKIRRLLEVRIAFGDADRLITRIYQKYVRFLFTSLGQILLGVLAVSGLTAFVFYTPNILLFFSFKHVSLILVLALIPFSLIEKLLHELGHAFTVKAFGREVHYIGAGWYWFSPIAFTDTSDMWLSQRRPRMLVNIAGVYVDILIAGFASLMILLIPNPYVQGMFWLFALYTYIGAFRMLSPLQEMDGYYFLMDWVEKDRLRQSAVVWLVKKFPKALRHPYLFRESWPEVSYWVACIVFLILVSLLTIILQEFIFVILGVQLKSYLTLILPFIVVLFSSLSIIADIRQQAED